MKNSEKTTFVVLMLLIIGFIFFAGNLPQNMTISGEAISDLAVVQKLDSFSMQTKIFLVQWVVVVLLILFFSTRYFKKRMRDKKNSEVNTATVHDHGGITHTDLDDFYKLLVTDEKVKISRITKEFGICKEKALEWSKIFEDEGIVTINYPAFLEPEVRLKKEKEAGAVDKEKKDTKQKGEEKEMVEGDKKKFAVKEGQDKDKEEKKTEDTKEKKQVISEKKNLRKPIKSQKKMLKKVSPKLNKKKLKNDKEQKE